MKRLVLFLLIGCFHTAMAQNEEAELEKRLSGLPGVRVEKYFGAKDRVMRYLLTVRQPLDHHDTTKGFFYQSALLTHKGFNRPMVLETEGYELHAGSNELQRMLDANHLDVEHRYFGKSRPDSLQWDYLTFEQITADLHRINELLRPLYTGKWISTGISRGGQVSIYYKYFFPGDVDLTVPYVAPLPNALEDQRIYHFLDTIGTPECRARLFQVQKFLLQHEDAAVEKLRWYAKGRKLTFNHFGSLERAFEFAVLEYPFAFWQIGSVPCAQVPANRSLDDYLEHMLAVGGIEFLSDQSITEWVPNGYMAHTQMGFYGYDLTRYRKYLRHVKGANPSAAFVPASVPLKSFDSSFTRRIEDWLDRAGNNILYVYGSIDTWSACRVIVSPKTNAKSFLLPGANHFQARVRNMSPDMQQEFADAVRQILGLDVRLDALK